MAKYKVGDRVKCIEKSGMITEGMVGTVLEVDDVPYVEWDGINDSLMIMEERIELFDPASEISRIIEQSITKSAEKIPVDRFEFCYIDEYGRDLTHRFEQPEGDYDLTDVIASFRLFLLGVGYEREEVNGIIREDGL